MPILMSGIDTRSPLFYSPSELRGRPTKGMLKVVLGKLPPHSLSLGDNFTAPPSFLAIFGQGQALEEFPCVLPPHMNHALF